MNYSLRPETYDKIIDRDQTSYYFFADGEKLKNEKKTLQLVLNGQPNTDLRQRTEARLDEITRQLEEPMNDTAPYLNLKKHINQMPIDAPVFDVLEQIKNVFVEYPAELLQARRAEYTKRLTALQSGQSGS